MKSALTLHPFLDTTLPIALAHRGGNEKFPENTLAAFQDAYDLGYRYFETDVHYTVDKELVAFHDGSLKRVLDIDIPIAALTKKQRLSIRFGNNQHVPLLSELLLTFPDAYFHIDAKSPLAVAPLAETIIALKAENRVCVSSFSAVNLLRLRKLLPDVHTTVTQRELALLRYNAPTAKLPPLKSRVISIPTHIFHEHTPQRVRLITERSIRRFHRRGCKVFVWTINDELQMTQLLNMGVDGFFTDKLRVLKKVLQDRGEWPE
jgi:glycerophosphoryl diester phosphodiesterase